jgi:hypothetical protein
VPTLSLGNLFERGEVRDLLALVALTVESRGVALVRVARFPEYGIPLADVRSFLAYVWKQELTLPAGLGQVDAVPGLSPAGRMGLGLLARHLDGLWSGGNAWSLLTHYLFNRSRYLHHLTGEGSVVGQQRGLAVYQLLQLAYARRTDADGDEPKRAFLHYVRSLQRYAKRQLSQVPEAAAGMDAVRLLTVHAAKGLEFDTVYLPWLGKGYFPASRQGNSCPPPVGMLPHSEDAEHEEEEESLFFVALSRAQNHLCLSRAKQYGRNSYPSDLLVKLADYLPHPPDGAVTWPSQVTKLGRAAEADAVDPTPDKRFEARMLEVYRDCPRLYLYEVELGLPGERADSAYLQFHRCVYQVVARLQQDRQQGLELDAAQVEARLTEVWEASGPVEHPYAPIYRRSAGALVAQAAKWMADRRGDLRSLVWDVALTHGKVRVRADYVEVQGDPAAPTVTVRRLRTGRATQNETDKDEYALYHLACRQAFPQAGAQRVEALYLATGTTVEVPMTPRKLQTRLNHYDEVMARIRRRVFPAAPDGRRCPTCAFFFVCPAAEDQLSP